MHPKFADLPLDPGHPAFSAWNLYPNDIGTLNLLTAERTVAAASEIRAGIRVGLDWDLGGGLTKEGFRDALKHEIYELGPNLNDDKLTFNTQSSTQWDGLRHWGFNGVFYNGVTQDEILSGKSDRLGTHEWTKRGIVGRGVLIDFVSYAQRNGIPYDPLSHYAISLDDVKSIAEACDVQFRGGDIIFLRTGLTAAWDKASAGTKDAAMSARPFRYPGIESTTDVAAFLWDNQIAAVAGDNPGFEAWPPSFATSNLANPTSNGTASSSPSASESEFGGGNSDLGPNGLHPVLLAGWGMPIGELFDLEELAAECERQQRWTFFVSSQPLNVKGGVASPPNALAIF